MSGVELATAYVSVVPSFKGFSESVSKEAGQAAKAADDAADEAGKSGGKWSTLKSTIAGVFTGEVLFKGAETIGDFLKDSVTDAASAQQQFAVLASSLKNVGITGSDAAEEAEKWITSTSEATGITKSDLIPSYSKLIQVTGSTEKAQKLLQTAMDASAGTHKSLGTVVDSVAKAYNGNVGALSRLGIETKNAQGKTESFNAVVSDMNKRFSGDTAAAADTAAGQMQRLSIQWDDMKEELGAKLLPVLVQLGTFMTEKVVPAIAGVFGYLDDHKTTAKVVAISIAALATAVTGLLIVAKVTEAWKSITELLPKAAVATEETTAATTELDAAMDANPMGLMVVGLTALGAALVLAYQKSATFRAIVQGAFGAIKDIVSKVVPPIASVTVGAWNAIHKATTASFGAIRSAIESVFTWVKAHWPLILSILTGPIGAAAIFIATHWSTIRSGTKAAWNAIHDFIVTPIRNAIATVKSVIDTVIGAMSRVWGTVKSDAKAAWSTIKSTVSGGISDVVSAISGLPDKIGGLAPKLLGAGESLGKVILNGITSALKGVGDLLGDISGSLKVGLNNAIGLPKNVGFSVMGHHIGFTIPGFAQGTLSAPGGLAVVGENGPELVQLPTGARVYTAAQTQAMAAAPSPLASGGAPVTNVRVFIGDRELTDIVKVQVDSAQTRQARQLAYGRKSA